MKSARFAQIFFLNRRQGATAEDFVTAPWFVDEVQVKDAQR